MNGDMWTGQTGRFGPIHFSLASLPYDPDQIGKVVPETQDSAVEKYERYASAKVECTDSYRVSM